MDSHKFADLGKLAEEWVEAELAEQRERQVHAQVRSRSARKARWGRTRQAAMKDQRRQQREEKAARRAWDSLHVSG